MPLSLRQAAQQAGTSKSTILRAVKSGRLSASRTDDGGYSIDPAELHRVYPVKPTHELAHTDASQRSAGQDALPLEAPAPLHAPDATALAVRNAALEAELEGLKIRVEELRQDRDRWHAQAERLALPAPVRSSTWGRWFSRPWNGKGPAT
jgi:excisionase family DNA binding protein